MPAGPFLLAKNKKRGGEEWENLPPLGDSIRADGAITQPTPPDGQNAPL